MHDSLIAYIKKYSSTPLKEGDEELIKNTFLPKRIRKKQYPEIIQRFPQHIIASYLGISKETLSRIRHQAVKK